MATDTTLDERRIRAMIKQAEMRSKAHKKNYNYEADWLVRGEIGSAEWVVSFPGTPELTTIDFDRLMSDGTRLTDEVNNKLLHTAQKWLFHCRIGSITGKPAAPRRWMTYFSFCMNLTSWAKIYQVIYDTSTHGFKLLNEDACKSIADELSRGSWTAALLLKERFISHLLDLFPGSFSLEDLLLDSNVLPVELTQKAIAHFEKHGLYVDTAQDSVYQKGMLSRDYIGSVLGRPATSLHNSAFRLFVRQFEPSLRHDHLLQRGVRKNTHNTQNTKTIEEAASGGMGISAFKDNILMLQLFFRGHKILPEDIPSVNINIEEIVLEYKKHLKPGGHTKLLPLEVGFECLNQAAKWILVYGQAVVDSLIFYAEEFVMIDEDNSLSKQSVKKQLLFQETQHLWITQAMGDLPAQRLDEALNITKLQTKLKKNFPEGESNYKMVMESFYGACAIIIGMLKPIRNKELSKLERNCLSTNTGIGGAFMRHSVGKTGALGINDEIERPIPYLAAYAIQLLQLLGNSLSKTYKDESEYASKLFYIPGRGFKCLSGKLIAWKLNLCMDSFCDAIKLPSDKLGRRWYVRVHEMRKFFILIVHRHVGDSGKELLRYFAGQSDHRHIDDYTAYEISDSEAIRYESECIDDKLIALEKGLLQENENQGLVALHTKALKDFKVTSISTINNKEFLKYLDKVAHQSEFDIRTYTVRLETYEDGVYAIDFAISLGDKKDAKYDS